MFIHFINKQMSYTEVYSATLIPATLKEGQLEELLITASTELNHNRADAWEALAEDEEADATEQLWDALKEQVSYQQGNIIITTTENSALCGAAVEELEGILLRETGGGYSFSTYTEIDSRRGGDANAWVQIPSGKVYGLQELAELASSLNKD